MRKIFAMMMAAVLVYMLCITSHAEASVVHVRTEDKVVALTFDDGPHPRYTKRILEVLDKYGVRATFFEVGINVERYPEVAKAVAAAGHEIGNHTYHHPHIGRLTDMDFESEVTACSQVIYDTTGTKPVLFRPPEGVRGDRRFAWLEGEGYKQILWNLDTLDWRGVGAKQIAKTVMREINGGDILLFHDYVAHDLTSDLALDRLIPALQNDGYRFVTVSELLTCGEIVEPHF